ncbi:MAG: DNA-directed RNA polymerase subunit alpha [Parcubacteria group bacterium SW_4_46_8]|nr:MAG: DNA-directed RNA polymerase subunit alpha [Parcubacteria group bacterium SW_4_46_8]
MDNDIVLPSQPTVVEEDENSGTYEIDGLYPGYGHTLGNSIRRIILSSLPGTAITQVKIDGVSHEFTAMDGVKEDVITILLNLKKVRIRMDSDEEQKLELQKEGESEVTAADIESPGQIEIVNPDQHIATITGKNKELDMELTVQKGLGYVSKETLKDGKADVGVIPLDASFSPIRRVNYEVENMRVGDRTDFNRLRLFIETDGTIEPNEVLERSIKIMIDQLKAVIDMDEEEETQEEETEEELETEETEEQLDAEFLKTRVESLDIATRTANSLVDANIRTVGGLVRKTESELLDIEGFGNKGLEEIKEVLEEHGAALRSK